jgi:hypothetical protein
VRELAARSDHLREQGQRLAQEVACVLAWLAKTEQHLAETFARGALAAPIALISYGVWLGWRALDVHRLRSKHAHLRQVTRQATSTVSNRVFSRSTPHFIPMFE